MTIKSFKHKGLEDFFYDGTTKGINAKHTDKLATRLDRLDAATKPQDMNFPNYRLHPLKGKMQGRWAIDVSGAWRLTFEVDGVNAIVVDLSLIHI